MTRCYVLVEGQTEEAFINQVVSPHLMGHGFHHVTPVVIATKRPADGGKYRGGIGSWSQFERELRNLLRDSAALVTSMVDLYALPTETPGVVTAPALPPLDRVRHIETAIADAIGAANLRPHTMLHEFETLLYADPAAVARHFADERIEAALHADISTCGSAEHVDEGPDTAPSKRIARHVTGYLKATDGPTITAEIGLPALRTACPHFHDWITDLERGLST